MNRNRCWIAGVALMLGTIVLAPKPASAICIYEDPVYDTGTLTGTGGTCSHGPPSGRAGWHVVYIGRRRHPSAFPAWRTS